MRAICLLPVVLLGLAGAASAENKFAPNKDPMTDAVGGDAILNTQGTIMTAVSCEPAPNKHLTVYFVSKEDLGYQFEQNGTIKVRIDSGTPFNLTGIYQDGAFRVEANVKPDSPGGHFIERTRTAKHMVVQVTEIGGGTVTDEFDLGDDAASTIDQAVAVCDDPDWNKIIKSSR